MAGINTDKEKLNRTLEFVANILHEENINDWFIFFGTLLGIVRENSCIQGDDDLDIMINCDYQQLRNTFEKRGVIFTSKFGINNSKTILKSEPTQEFASFDFYICNVNESGDFYTPWHRVNASEPKPFITKEWWSTTLNLPDGYLQKIISMYGKDWEIPQSKSCKMGLDV
jgi:hypothetical protein